MSKHEEITNRRYPIPPPPRRKVDPLLMLKDNTKITTIAGPMVRYSKLPFRQLVRQYHCDIVYTPMILAREFVRNGHARISDFSTCQLDTPLIVQVGVNNVSDLLKFVEMVAPFVDAVGINCGCPIKEQIREGIGCALIYNEELLIEMVKEVKLKWKDQIRLETKIRIHDDWDRSLKLCVGLCEVGVDWITIHGRTRTTRSSQPVNLDAIKYIIEGIRKAGFEDIPIVANGDCFTMKDFKKIAEYTKCQGVMAVRGLLNNPALFSGYDICPWSCIENFWYWVIEFGGIPYQLIQHHFYCMLENMNLKKKLLNEMMEIKSLVQLMDWFDDNFELKRYNNIGFGQSIEIPYRIKD
ncbi:tRNA dihydrouridine synthase NDAI_0J02380 [Naumovozyma dairenensis CBS 421]|uniref:tRNA-dihydrouridine synthase n=1 Tax=Naumovozyma dairenensis (strain ATCC 10597 / BCRC 20456 / CBS 421 / NBRC 0211 / NRRL Y-12639) TaxID=1071378 RepID=G0WH52_NAUDC|nr:hypothetical protein NDAI_0J02380 [Naumovozyma dairenensis CBS 421]CCD27130.1 hypothetical protein NDAI_0J02380 [Naumovozyma dairenensis CBS 421]